MRRDDIDGAGAAAWAVFVFGLTAIAVTWLLFSCASAVQPPSAEKSWRAALTTYEALAVGMEVYCGTPQANPTPCIQAATASIRAENVIKATRESLASGHATEAILEASAAALRAAEPTLRAVQPPGQE